LKGGTPSLHSDIFERAVSFERHSLHSDIFERAVSFERRDPLPPLRYLREGCLL
jgi:hypothetical protein